MVALLHIFTFDIKEVEAVKKQVTAHFARSSRIGNHDYTQNIGAWDESFDFTATFYNANIASVKFLELLLKQKQPVWFVMLSGEALEVTIDEIKIARSWFDGGGIPVKQEVNFTLKAWYE